MALEFYSFLCDQIRALIKNGDNAIVKDDEFESLREEKEIFTWSIYYSLFLFYNICSGSFEGNESIKKQLFEKAEKVSGFIHKVMDKIDLPPSIISNKNAISIINQNFNHIENFKQFISQEYNAPADIDILLSHLGTIYLFYMFLSSHDIIPINLISRIDFVMTRLTSTANFMIASIIVGGHNIERTKRSAMTRQENAKRKMDEIISIYEKKRENSQHWEDLSGSQQAKFIADVYREKGETPPKKTTIRNYIRTGKELDLI